MSFLHFENLNKFYLENWNQAALELGITPVLLILD
jgi:hypothetical protein